MLIRGRQIRGSYRFQLAPLKFLPLALASLLVSFLFLSSACAASGSTGPSVSSVDLGTVPRGVAVNTESGVVYAVLFLNGRTEALTPQTFAVLGRVATPSPYAIAFNSVTDQVYVSQGEKTSISVIDGSGNSVTATISGAGTPYAMSVDEPQDLIFAADTASNSLWVINGSTDTTSARLPMGDTSALAFDPVTHLVFVGNLSSDFKSGTVVGYSSDTLKAVRSLPIPIPPGHYALDPMNHLLFVSSSGTGGSGSSTNFLAIDVTTFTVAYSSHLGESPDVMALAVSPDVFVSDPGQGRLYEIDGTTGAVLFNSSGDSQTGVNYAGITSMAFDAGSGKLYITERDSTSLIILDAGAAASQPFDLTYLYLGVPLLAVIVVIGAALWRRRSPAEPRTRA